MSWDEGASDLPKDPWPYSPETAKAAMWPRFDRALDELLAEIGRRDLVELNRRVLAKITDKATTI